MGILVQNNLTGLLWYVKDRTRRGLPTDPNDIVLDDLHRGHLAYEAYVQNRDKGENIKPSRNGAINMILTIGIARLPKPYPSFMDAIIAPLHM